MARKKQDRNETSVTRVNPSFLAEYADEDHSMDAMMEHRVIPRLKIIQGQSHPDLKKQFGEGSIVVRPGDAMVREESDEDPGFLFVPQVFFTEFCKWADRRDTDSPAIVARSFLKSDEVAIKAMDPETRFEEYPDQESKKAEDRWKYRYVEHFCFGGVIYGDHDLAGTECVLEFSRGEHGTGRNFISAITMRKGENEETGQKFKIPLWAQVWELKSVQRQRNGNNWWGFEFAPAGEIQEQDVPVFQEAHKELKEAHDKNILVVDFQKEPDEGGVSDDEAEM